MKIKIDDIDKKILMLLQHNSTLTYKEIAQKINLSLSPVHDRIKRLEQEGVVEKYVGILNKKMLGVGLTVFSQVTLIRQTREVSQIFDIAIKQLPEVVECNFVSGSFDYLLKIIVADMEAYHNFHQMKLSTIEGVSLINSFFVMSEVKSTTEIML
ncbi:Lrp/AsnC family transcriptional regulator [Lacihabitans soyangensis]|jgi:Lrp/AsnC family transcriptional regulator, leucine-responsive regulatory protein|uniref:Lrp/AsnC family transcriptional regulator n=1 Tax=Lacihabitans soyangensis TaxID=869394 RepID=UPI0020CDE5F5|nr:Lrp/AsnC family transcriptional regulator [Lacihabitans soyangensis]HLO45472.1 Lrp/AsnC family transcriptional regulator [Leadbetterella sp.]